MAGNQEGSGWLGPALIAGAVGIAVWRRLSPDTRQAIWWSLQNAAAEHERRKMAELAKTEQLFIPSLEDLDFGPHSLDIPPRPIEPIVEAAPSGTRFLDYVANYELPDPEDEVPENPAPIVPDWKWLDVIQHPSIAVILGKRDSGKSALGYRLLELNKYRLRPYVVGLPESAQEYLPGWLGSVPTLDDLPHDSIALIVGLQQNGTAMIFLGNLGSSLTHNWTGTMPST